MVLLVALCPAVGQAGDKEDASALFKEGNEFRLAGKYAEALERYQRAYKLYPSYKIGFNVALSQEKLGNHVGAYKSYIFFLRAGAGKSPEKMLDVAKAKVASLKEKIALVKIVSKVDGATVRVDNVEIGRTPLTAPLVRATGPCTVGLEAKDHQPFKKRLDLKGGQELTLEVVLRPVPSALTEPAGTEPDVHTAGIPASPKQTKQPSSTLKPMPEPPSRSSSFADASDAEYELHSKRRSKTIWAWTALGLGLASAVGAGVLYGVGSSQVNSAYDEYRGLPNNASKGQFDEKWSEVESAGNLYIGGHILSGVSAAALSASIYLFLTRPHELRRQSSAIKNLLLGVSTGEGQAVLNASVGF